MLAGVFNKTQDFQEAMAEFSQLYPVKILQELLNGTLSNPGFNISSLLPAGLAYTDPHFFHSEASNITSTTQVCPRLPVYLWCASRASQMPEGIMSNHCVHMLSTVAMCDVARLAPIL